MRLTLLIVILTWLVASLAVRAGAGELVMLREAGCGYCQQWEEEIGVVYDKTAEGRRLPLRRLSIHDPLPDDLKFLVKGGYTPTFILVEGGREIGRIRGYPGEDFFWGLLGALIKRLPPDSPARSRLN